MSVPSSASNVHQTMRRIQDRMVKRKCNQSIMKENERYIRKKTGAKNEG